MYNLPTPWNYRMLLNNVMCSHQMVEGGHHEVLFSATLSPTKMLNKGS